MRLFYKVVVVPLDSDPLATDNEDVKAWVSA